MGNLHSVEKAFQRLGHQPLPVHSNSDLDHCDALVLPGVGSFDPAMTNLKNSNLIIDISNWVRSGKSFLGICLGLQLLFESSDEGYFNGLGLVKGKVKKIPQILGQRIPHVGWGKLSPTKKNILLKENDQNNWVYFVHSYHVVPEDSNIIAAQVNYGTEKLTAIIENDNLLACQFHPEKSGKIGEKLLRRWIKNIQ